MKWISFEDQHPPLQIRIFVFFIDKHGIEFLYPLFRKADGNYYSMSKSDAGNKIDLKKIGKTTHWIKIESPIH